MTQPKARRAPRGWTYDPCPGCAQTTEPRQSGKVCAECSTVLRNAKLREAEIAERGADAPQPYGVPSASHWLPYILHDGGERTVQKAFHDVLYAASEHREDHQFSSDAERLILDRKGDSRSSADQTRLFRPSLAGALRALFEAIRDGLERAYEDGKDDGSNLLRQLRDGALSPDDFDRRTDR